MVRDNPKMTLLGLPNLIAAPDKSIITNNPLLDLSTNCDKFREIFQQKRLYRNNANNCGE